MKEEFLFYVWKNLKFGTSNLKTTEGKSISILKTGYLNHDAGPDFSNASIRLDHHTWYGNIEIHVKSSDWYKHGHSKDLNYENIILHVVFEEDVQVKRFTGEVIPCLALKPYIHPNLQGKYQYLQQQKDWIPCASMWNSVSEINRILWLERMGVERIESKANLIQISLENNKSDWEATFFVLLTKYFGLKVNSGAFEQMANSFDYKIIPKIKNRLLSIEALLFGQAGLLDQTFVDAYPKLLQKEYQFLKSKFSLQPLLPNAMKMSRMRPANFPTVRLAQLAAFLYQTDTIFSKIIMADNINEIENLFDITTSIYWHNHYSFDKQSIQRKKKFGKNMVDLIIINVIVPMTFLYGKTKDLEKFKKKASEFLNALPNEKNSILKNWKALGQGFKSAFDSQSLIHLKNNYCNQKRCLNCAVGKSIIGKKEKETV